MEGRFHGGCFALPVWGLIFGGACTWRGLISEFYGISVSCKLAQWRVADPVAFYTSRMTVIFGISGYVKLVTLYCHAIFWGTEGLGEGCVEIMQIVSCLELMANLFIFIHNGGI